MTRRAEDPGLRWNLARTRASALQQQQPHAVELLTFYLELIDLQEAIFLRTLAGKWLDVVRSPAEEPPWLSLNRLPFASLRSGFKRFIRDVSAITPERLQGIAQALGASRADVLVRLLEEAAQKRDVHSLAAQLGCEGTQTEFFPRAFLQPVVEATAAHHARDVSTWGKPRCPQCGWAPQVSVIRDEPEIQGQRLLICSLCATWWPFPRARCPSCLESRTDQLPHHVAESLPHVRVEECLSCRTYIKTIDLRQQGTAVPVVDDIASVELDLWCQERQLTKLQRNVLGL